MTLRIFKEDENCKSTWHETKANFIDGENDKLQIQGKPVMERWETPYVKCVKIKPFSILK